MRAWLAAANEIEKAVSNEFAIRVGLGRNEWAVTIEFFDASEPLLNPPQDTRCDLLAGVKTAFMVEGNMSNAVTPGIAPAGISPASSARRLTRPETTKAFIGGGPSPHRVRRFPLQAPAIAENPDGSKGAAPAAFGHPSRWPLDILEIPEAFEEARPLARRIPAGPQIGVHRWGQACL